MYIVIDEYVEKICFLKRKLLLFEKLEAFNRANTMKS